MYRFEIIGFDYFAKIAFVTSYYEPQLGMYDPTSLDTPMSSTGSQGSQSFDSFERYGMKLEYFSSLVVLQISS